MYGAMVGFNDERTDSTVRGGGGVGGSGERQQTSRGK